MLLNNCHLYNASIELMNEITVIILNRPTITRQMLTSVIVSNSMEHMNEVRIDNKEYAAGLFLFIPKLTPQ